MNVRFTNSTTGASAAATWAWNFGNGNTSTLRDPGASYFTEQAYTVTLTVTDGAATNSKSITINVYKKPTVDFSVSPASGCVPLNVNFTAIATAGDGTIANYLWDFGDGSNVQGAGFSTTVHTYTLPQSPPVTLNVTNSFGCYTTITKNNQVTATRSVTVAFTSSSSSLCNAGESITFTNSSTGSGTLTYRWDFGDGTASSNLPSPVHVYAASGSFISKLTVSSSDGCSATQTGAAINVANFTSDFSMPAKICQNATVNFTNSSTNGYSRTEWLLDGQLVSSYNYSYNTSFNSPGTHTLKLVNWYGPCSVATTKSFTVEPAPVLYGFISELQGACGVPVTIKFTDTCSAAVSWKWETGYFGGSQFGTSQTASKTFTAGYGEYVYLTVTNSNGCTANTLKYINYQAPQVDIRPTNTYQGCAPMSIHFNATPDSIIKSFKWNFGDGSAIDTNRSPTHTYTSSPTSNVSLQYITTGGCAGTAYFGNVYITVDQNFDFVSTPSARVCGNEPVTFTASPATAGWTYYWYFNDTLFNNGWWYGSSVVQKFRYDTTYTVKLIAVNNGCSDTVIKPNFIKVLPPFPHIEQGINTCDGNRGTVRFTENSVKAQRWSWNFGDGTTETYSAFKDTIIHAYTTSGAYNVVLSATNGTCTVKDSINTYVLLRQNPLLTCTQNSTCNNNVVPFQLSGFETNPYPSSWSNGSGFTISRKEYGDGSTCNASSNYYDYYFQNGLNFTLTNFEPGQSSIRMITTSSGFYCNDTSNFVPLRTHGPAAGFFKASHSGCFKDAVAFTDTSHGFGGVAIIKWEWNFGDNSPQTLTSSGSITHLYSAPGYYYVTLKVTDADGCSSQTEAYGHYIQVGGPKANFNASSFTVPINSTVSFYNTSSFYEYYCSLLWIFSDSTTSANPYPSFFYSSLGNYPVTLITNNPQTGCTDTVTKIIAVRKVNSAFTYNLSYINNNACPPVIATFRSISSNAVRLSWDFGDGSSAGDQQAVSHTYNNPGMYRVVHYSYDSNNAVDSTEDFIEVKGPYALLKTDNLFACNTLRVKLTAEVRNAAEFTWDFGDGSVVPTTDTFAVHQYLTPGIYAPSLILRDAGGCTATSSLPEKIIVDSLSASFSAMPASLCDSGQSIFTAQVYSLSSSALQTALQYTWITNELTLPDTSYTTAGSHYFSTPGAHAVRLIVSSLYGCQQTVDKTITVNPGVTASIAGINSICQETSASFTGSAIPAGNTLQWKWDFANGNTASIANPPAQTFNTTGAQQISLVVSNGTCADTAYHSLMVHSKPTVSITPEKPFVCRGNTTTLFAAGGTAYQWYKAGSTAVISPADNILVNPVTGSFYTVNVTNVQGCSSRDSVLVKVIDPVQLTAPQSLFACQGQPVQLNAAGAASYKWINTTDGISNVSIANPTALSPVSVSYTVVGYAENNCFSDTASIVVRISALPLVDAGVSQEVASGTAVTLHPTVSGAVNWAWSPATFLSCVDCLNPVSKATASTTYTLQAYNADGCSASDFVTIKMLCKDNLVFIPNAFSPNGDTKNDRFTVTGTGLKTIRSVTIYNRWGKVLFERKDISIDDRNNSWDGTYNGEPQDAGTYVYFIQTVCEGGEVFTYKGTVTLVR